MEMKPENLFMIAALLFVVYFMFSKAEGFEVTDPAGALQKSIDDAYNAYVFGLRKFTR